MRKLGTLDWILLGLLVFLPILDRIFGLDVAPQLPRVMVFAMLALGLNVITGFTGLLHLGLAALMAIGVYTFGILTVETYPFRFDFWTGLAAATVVSALAGVLLGAPMLRLRGDYLAIVTLGFGEIVVDAFRNLEIITKGQKGINPLPPPYVPGYEFDSMTIEPLYYLFLTILLGLAFLSRNLENSKLGREWVAIREDELAATCMSINPARVKLVAFAVGSAMAGIAGVLFASQLSTTSEPQTYDFNVSITALCILIVGGIGNIRGVLIGSLLLMGFDTIVVNKLAAMVQDITDHKIWGFYLNLVYWKWLIFGLALVLMVRFKPEGFFPSERAKAELHEGDRQEGGA